MSFFPCRCACFGKQEGHGHPNSGETTPRRKILQAPSLPRKAPPPGTHAPSHLASRSLATGKASSINTAGVASESPACVLFPWPQFFFQVAGGARTSQLRRNYTQEEDLAGALSPQKGPAARNPRAQSLGPRSLSRGPSPKAPTPAFLPQPLLPQLAPDLGGLAARLPRTAGAVGWLAGWSGARGTTGSKGTRPKETGTRRRTPA